MIHNYDQFSQFSPNGHCTAQSCNQTATATSPSPSIHSVLHQNAISQIFVVVKLLALGYIYKYIQSMLNQNDYLVLWSGFRWHLDIYGIKCIISNRGEIPLNLWNLLSWTSTARNTVLLLILGMVWFSLLWYGISWLGYGMVWYVMEC